MIIIISILLLSLIYLITDKRKPKVEVIDIIEEREKELEDHAEKIKNINVRINDFLINNPIRERL